MCIITKGAIVWLLAAPLPGMQPDLGALQAQTNTYVFDDQGICERHVPDGSKLLCAPMQMVTCPSERKRR